MEILKTEFTHKDARRELSQLFTATTEQVNIYKAKKGAVLGDHFHKETKEYFYIIKGTVSYNDTIKFEKGNLFVVPPFENHMIRCLTPVTMMTFLTRPYEKDKSDIWTNKS